MPNEDLLEEAVLVPLLIAAVAEFEGNDDFEVLSITACDSGQQLSGYGEAAVKMMR